MGSHVRDPEPAFWPSSRRVEEAFVTFISVFSNPQYTDALGTLAASLANTNTTRGLVAFIDDWPTPQLRCIARHIQVSLMDFHLLRVPIIQAPSNGSTYRNDTGSHRKYRSTFTKLHIWNAAALIGARRVIFLDVDVLVLQSIDDLFVSREAPWPRVAQEFGVGCPWVRREFLDSYQTCIRPRLQKLVFNSGVMVLEPSQMQFERMLASLDVLGSGDGSDQDFLFRYNATYQLFPANGLLPHVFNVFALEELPHFRSWPWNMSNEQRRKDQIRYTLPTSEWLSLPPDGRGFSLDSVKVLHFAGSLKPSAPDLATVAPLSWVKLEEARRAMCPNRHACRVCDMARDYPEGRVERG